MGIATFTGFGAAALQILYEDDWLLAVNKPPGIITAPKHRFQVHTAKEAALRSNHGTGPVAAVLSLKPGRSAEITVIECMMA